MAVTIETKTKEEANVDKNFFLGVFVDWMMMIERKKVMINATVTRKASKG